MKTFSMPILIAAAVIILGAGGFILYATSGYTYSAPPKNASAEMQSTSVQASATDGTSSSGNGTSADTPGAVTTTDSGTASGQARPSWGGQGDRGTPEEREQRRQQRMQQMATELGLTDAQKQQMEEIRKTVTDRTQRRAAIMAILNPDQQAKFEQMRANGGGHRDRGGNGGAAPGANAAPAGGNH